VSARTFWAFLGVLAVVGLLAYGLISKGTSRIALGEPIPDRTLPALSGDGSGSIADYRGRWVLVNLWASWCVPCEKESPGLEAFYRQRKADGFTILGVDSKEVADDGRAFAAEHHLTYPQLYDGPGTFGDDLGTNGYPENFLVDPAGKIRLIRLGPVTPEYLRDAVAPLLQRGSRD
jgi:cytochrome c biogenesis protein CcmG, thiol:disulfide interchange protein DsbE